MLSITNAPLMARPITFGRTRVDRTRIVAQSASTSSKLAPPTKTHEIASIAAKTTPAPVTQSRAIAIELSAAQAFGIGFIASAGIIKAHISAKSGSKLRKKKPILRYFDARGAAEVIRTIFAAANVEYDDYRYTFSMDGPKPQICDQHGIDKESGVFDANLMRLPILEVGNDRIGQSRAIERYVAKDLGLMGKGKIQEAQIDAYCEHIRDLRDAYNKVRGNPFAPTTPEIEEAKEKWYSDTMKTWMKKIEAVTGDNGFAVGDKVSLADIVLYCALTQAFSDADKAAASFADCEKISAVLENVAANQGVQKWLETRPDNKF
jgi:glutathione S-transferase